MQHKLSIGNNVGQFVINTFITINNVTIGDIILPQKYVICTTNANQRQLTFEIYEDQRLVFQVFYCMILTSFSINE